MHACNLHIQVMYLCYLHTEASLDMAVIAHNIPQRCLNIKASTGHTDLHKPMPPLPCPTHMPCAKCSKSTGVSENQNAQSHIFSCNVCVYSGPAKRHLWSLGAVTSTRKRSCKEGWFQVPCCGDTSTSTQMLKAVLPHLRI